MTLLNPTGLLLLLAIPVIVLLHLFLQERRRHEVSSLFLWREISDQHSQRIRPRLLRNIHLLLQILAAALAALALAQPVLPGGERSSAARMIVLIDTSASMRAQEEQITRLELAKNRARELIGRSRRDTQVMVATSGARPSIVQSFTADRNTLYDVIRTVQAEDGSGNLPQTAQMLRGIETNDSTEIHLITDGAFVLEQDVVLPRNFSVERVGGIVANRGITAFNVRERLDGSAFEAYLEVANFDSAPAEVTLQLEVDDRSDSQLALSLDANEIRPVAVILPERSGSVFTARLAGNTDALPTDDVVRVVARTVRPLRVQLVTEGNYFLESILSVYPNTVLTVTPTVDRTFGYDLLILDGVDAPAGTSGNIIAFDAEVPGSPFAGEDSVPVAAPVTMNATHPISANVDLSNVNITRATAGTLDGRSRLVATAGRMPLIFAASWKRVRMVGFTFTLADTDLGLRSSFPILIDNTIQWLAPSPQEEPIGSVDAMSVVPLLVSAGESVEITSPSGEVSRYEPRENTIDFSRTREAGVYTVSGESFADLFAVSLRSATESNLAPRISIPEPEESTIALAASSPGLPLWPWLTLCAVLLLTADWIIWARRT